LHFFPTPSILSHLSFLTHPSPTHFYSLSLHDALPIYAILPILTVATFFIAVYARLTRASLLDIEDAEYIRTARAKGLAPWRITWFHRLRNALIPVSTMAGVHFAALFGGAAVTETV